MNMARFFVLSAVTAIIVSATSTYAAPCESVASAGASTAFSIAWTRPGAGGSSRTAGARAAPSSRPVSPGLEV